MKIIFVSATELEVKPLINHFNLTPTIGDMSILKENIYLLITGVGMLETSLSLINIIEKEKPDLVVGIGVAGSYSPQFLPGKIVEVTTDQYGDLGADDHGTFIPGEKLGLIQNQVIEMKPAFPELEKVSGITVNQVAGSKEVIQQRKILFNADVETMEGLALFKVCKAFNIPCSQIRAISNMVEPRNRFNWEMDKAIGNLNGFVLDFVNSLR